jgi:hypothetical protein
MRVMFLRKEKAIEYGIIVILMVCVAPAHRNHLTSGLSHNPRTQHARKRLKTHSIFSFHAASQRSTADVWASCQVTQV